MIIIYILICGVIGLHCTQVKNFMNSYFDGEYNQGIGIFNSGNLNIAMI
ncbi:hypothetical protein GGR09_001290 [Bartonella heixiaziensis]